MSRGRSGTARGRREAGERGKTSSPAVFPRRAGQRRRSRGALQEDGAPRRTLSGKDALSDFGASSLLSGRSGTFDGRGRRAFSVLYEDQHCIVVEKEARVLSQSDASRRDSLPDQVKAYIKERDGKPGEVFLGIVHRLDFLTSGLIVFAKRSKAAARLSEQVRGRAFEKMYLAVAEEKSRADSAFEEEGGRLRHWIKKEEQDLCTELFDKPGEGRSEAELFYLCLGKRDGLGLYLILLKTGRRHQIRAQFAAVGRELMGDHRYARGARARGERELALHAAFLRFFHPMNGDVLSFRASLPRRGAFRLFRDVLETCDWEEKRCVLKRMAEEQGRGEENKSRSKKRGTGVSASASGEEPRVFLTEDEPRREEKRAEQAGGNET